MRYSVQQYAAALCELARETPHAKQRGMIRGFLALLEKERALSVLPEIARAYGEEEQRVRGVRTVTVTAPERLSQTALARRLRLRARIDSVRDPRLKGGVTLQSGDLRVDNSVQMRLERVRQALQSNTIRNC